ncbi:uncharacterized protein LOC135849268 [Planococcus citri]|uniref:uncharacterized protein LOC135849268 n=1 Tax=Planococcus citri TaxID=170843 RepID=UPI0031FA04F4
MFQTEFCGLDYNFVVSWDLKNHEKFQDPIFKNDFSSCQDILNKLTELCVNLSSYSSEYVECLKNVYGSASFDQWQSNLSKNNPSIKFTLKNQQNEHRLEEISLLRQRIKRLTREKEELVAEHENLMFKEQNDFDQRIRDVIKLNHARLDSVKRGLEDKYNSEISNLRASFESKFAAAAGQPTIEGSCQCSRNTVERNHLTTESNSEHVEATTSTKFSESGINCFSNEENLNNSVEMLDFQSDQSHQNESHDSLNISDAKHVTESESSRCGDHVELSLNRMDIEERNSQYEISPEMPEPVIDERLSSVENVEKLLAELPAPQTDYDSFVFPFPIKQDMFEDSFWTFERKRDMSLVNELIKIFMNRKSMKKLLPIGGFSKYKEYCHGNVFPCWEIDCLIRNKRFPTMLHRDAHVKKYHPDGRTIFICGTCHWPESTQEALHEHEMFPSKCRKRKRC